ncbi:Ubiquinone biosynthesis protein coq9, mitochondrial [Kickxella alabastrina]|uniref:Ubiquinone biosynthesis protein coq9, mitochondrial n=1 Tax=Kickxella alabastrina TaxID=61397 RepID=A0ACC1IQ47_9FUNG|nr:Ubiquinone biosynthesis protein coq9, mitochondrial [Kickxella alabastrina]
MNTSILRRLASTPLRSNLGVRHQNPMHHYHHRTLTTTSNTQEDPQQRDPVIALLDHALTKVPTHGWTTHALTAAATDLGYSPLSHTIATKGAPTLISHFLDRALDNTLIEVDDQLHELDTTNDRLRLICRTRLRQTMPLVERWPEAVAVLALPQNVPLAVKQLGRMSSEFWFAAGDQSKNIDWYARRSALAAAYVAAELYMCEDRSPGYEATFAFLDRRMHGIQSLENDCNKVLGFATQFSRNFYNILSSRGLF